MAISLNFGDGGDDYQAEAERARLNAQRGKGGKGGPSPIAVVLDLLGIGRQVAKPPKGDSAETGDLASTPKESTQAMAVTDKKGDVLGTVEQVVNQSRSTEVKRLPLAPLELAPLDFQGQVVPRPLTRIDPTTGIVM